MRNTIAQYLAKIGAGNDREALVPVLQAIAAQVNTQALNTAGLVISSAGAVTAKIGATDFYATVRGALVKIAAGTALPVLTGLTITANRFNVACFFVDASGATSVLFGTEAAAIGNVKWPDFPIDKALVGIAIITHSATFTGNTTPLDTATTVYLSPIGAVDPTILYT